jgi:hypothetical protein
MASEGRGGRGWHARGRRPAIVAGVLALTMIWTTAGPARDDVGAAEIDLESRVPTDRIEVGPDVLVSRDGDDPHVEMTLAADPRDPKVLLGASMILPTLRPYSEARTGSLYSSRNGGHTWAPLRLPRNGSMADPQVAFGVDGTAFHVGTWVETPGGGNKNLLVFRSADGGRTWSDLVDLGAPADHEVVAVDHTQGAYRGRFYIASFSKHTKSDFAAGRGEIVVYRSMDDGRTFAPPVVAMKARAYMSVIAYSSHVLSDGTLVVGVLESLWRPGGNARTGSYPNARFVMVASSDGGATFGAPRTVHDFGETDWADFVKVRTQFAVAADVSKGRFRDRMYSVWRDPRDPRSRLICARSDAGGRTWTEPIEIAAGRGVGSQFQPVAAVNGQGVLGVSWLESSEPETGRYDVYFTASLDGGRTFLAPERVNSRPSVGRGLGNQRLMSFLPVQGSGKGITARFSPAHAAFPTGGDYTGMVADAEGVFHPFWPDSRNGVFQIFTSRIRVRQDDDRQETEQPRDAVSLNEQVTLVFDPVQQGPEKGGVVFPMRLQNTSRQRIYGPLRVEVRKVLPENAIQNATNGKPGVGAVFDFTPALRDVGYLDPDGVTEAVDVRLLIGDRHAGEVVLDVEVTGNVKRRR